MDHVSVQLARRKIISHANAYYNTPFSIVVTMCDVRARRACRRFRSPPRWRLEFEDGGGTRAAGAHDVQIGAATFGLVEAVRSRCGLGFFADEAL